MASYRLIALVLDDATCRNGVSPRSLMPYERMMSGAARLRIVLDAK
jgi:hypothetical protein